MIFVVTTQFIDILGGLVLARYNGASRMLYTFLRSYSVAAIVYRLPFVRAKRARIAYSVPCRTATASRVRTRSQNQALVR